MSMLANVLSRLVRRSRPTLAIASAQSSAQGTIDQAKALIASGLPDQAEQRLRQAMTSLPESADLYRLLGSLLGSSGRVDEARQLLQRALALAPGSALALADMGNVLRLQGCQSEAESCYRRALDIDPDLLNVRLNLASLLEQERPDQAVEIYLQCALNTAHPMAIRRAITLLDSLERSADARRLCERTLQRDPMNAEAHRGLGFVLLKRELQADRALPHLERAVALDPNDVEALANRGIALQDLGRIDDAISSYDAALALEPQHRVARFHRALARLLRGDFAQAWEDYELRLLTEDRPARSFVAPRWRGEDVADKTLLIYAEQGIGDEMMFASCIPDAIRVCKHVIVECSAKLAPIFARSFPSATVHGGSQFDDPGPLNALGAHLSIPSGSLPLHFRAGSDRFPRHAGYLLADEQITRHYRERLAQLGPGLKVGLSWRGGTARSRGPLRTLDLSTLAPLLQIEGARFVNLQYDSRPEELAWLREAHSDSIHHWPDALDDYDRTAALVSALDLVISVCTAVVHLGGALGRPVWVMAPYSPEWRYGISGQHMAWYPSICVFRQTAPGDWNSVLTPIEARLRATQR